MSATSTSTEVSDQQVRQFIGEGIVQSIAAGDLDAMRDWSDALAQEPVPAGLEPVRHQIDLSVSLFAYDVEDARGMAKLLRDKLDREMGGGQAVVKIAAIAPVTATGLFNA